jgi:hypothetical protein
VGNVVAGFSPRRIFGARCADSIPYVSASVPHSPNPLPQETLGERA